MKFLIISPGKQHDHGVSSAIKEYEVRLSSRHDIAWEFPQVSTKEKEGEAILKQIKDTDFVVLLDEEGKMSDSAEFARRIATPLHDGVKRIVFIIGGAYGVSSEVKERADTTVSLSKMVFPHMLVRLILIEQIYRAMTILEGGKYHHD